MIFINIHLAKTYSIVEKLRECRFNSDKFDRLLILRTDDKLIFALINSFCYIVIIINSRSRSLTSIIIETYIIVGKIEGC